MNGLSLLQTTSRHEAFKVLVSALSDELASRNRDTDRFFVRHNKTTFLGHVVVAFKDGQPVGCGSFKEFDAKTIEIKRMYVIPAFRGTGVAHHVLTALERWAKALAYERSVLVTAVGMVEAVAFYRRSGYRAVPNYGPYSRTDFSVCFEKRI